MQHNPSIFTKYRASFFYQKNTEICSIINKKELEKMKTFLPEIFDYYQIGMK